jgi:biopolymer transport protein ExbD
MAGQSMHRRRRGRSSGTVKLTLTSMVDMFTLIVVFLLKNYSAQGQMVTPAQGLLLPSSSVEKSAGEALSVKISEKTIMVENDVVVNEAAYKALLVQKDFMIEPLFKVLSEHSKSARKSAEVLKTVFSGRISIQGDVAIPYNVLTRVMYTCGQAGYPVMNLVVYRKA